MNGEPEESEDEEGGAKAGKRKTTKQRGGDDLEDDFYEADGIAALGAGLGEDGVHEGNDEDGEDDEMVEGENGDEGEEDSEEGEDDEDDEEDSDDSDDIEAEDGEAEALVASDRTKVAARKNTPKELPFTFPCPTTHDEFLDIVEGVEDKDVPTVVQRIRTLHHPSLAEDNKVKLQVRLLSSSPACSVSSD